MTLSEFSLHRPVASIVMSLVIVLFGAVGFNFLGVRLYPAIDPPSISVRTNYTGANADIIEAQISEPLEKAINGIEGIKSISSSSSTGSSNITAEFNVGADLEKAANDVRDKVFPGLTKSSPGHRRAARGHQGRRQQRPDHYRRGAEHYHERARTQRLRRKHPPGKAADHSGREFSRALRQKRPAMRLWLNPDKWRRIT